MMCLGIRLSALFANLLFDIAYSRSIAGFHPCQLLSAVPTVLLPPLSPRSLRIGRKAPSSPLRYVVFIFVV